MNCPFGNTVLAQAIQSRGSRASGGVQETSALASIVGLHPLLDARHVPGCPWRMHEVTMRRGS